MPYNILFRWILQDDWLYESRGEFPRDYPLSKAIFSVNLHWHDRAFCSRLRSMKLDYATKCGNRLSAWVSSIEIAFHYDYFRNISMNVSIFFFSIKLQQIPPGSWRQKQFARILKTRWRRDRKSILRYCITEKTVSTTFVCQAILEIIVNDLFDNCTRWK